MASEVEKRESIVGTIEHTRKMLAFLVTLVDPSETAKGLIRQYEAEIKGYFEKNKSKYQVLEKRVVRYALVDVNQIRQNLHQNLVRYLR